MALVFNNSDSEENESVKRLFFKDWVKKNPQDQAPKPVTIIRSYNNGAFLLYTDLFLLYLFPDTQEVDYVHSVIEGEPSKQLYVVPASNKKKYLLAVDDAVDVDYVMNEEQLILVKQVKKPIKGSSRK